MFANPPASWYQRHEYSAQSPCDHCGGVVRHQKWCITCDPAVQYAYRAVLEPDKLTLCDQLILHALGVTWGKNRDGAACQQIEKR